MAVGHMDDGRDMFVYEVTIKYTYISSGGSALLKKDM